MAVYKNFKLWFLTFLHWKYRNSAILIIGFLLWIVWLAPNNVNTQYNLFREQSNLRELKNYYVSEITKNEKKITLFRHNKTFVEKYAREQYLMKRENEDIFLVIEANSDKE